MHALDLSEAPKRDGYAIFGGSIHGDSSSSDDACSRPRWMINNGSLDSSSSVPFDTLTSIGSANGFENLILD
jgi:hypothetical protein